MDVITEFSRRGGGPTRRPNRASLRTELLQVTIQLAHAQQFPERRRHHETCEARQYQHRKSPVRGPPGDASFEPSQELEAGARARMFCAPQANMPTENRASVDAVALKSGPTRRVCEKTRYTSGELCAMVKAETGTSSRVSPFKVAFSVRLSSSNFFWE